MRDRPTLPFGTRRIAGSFFMVLLSGALCSPPARADDRRSSLKFALEMAQKGNWREARFRWERLVTETPDDPFILNNLAVAQEALGDADAARSTFEKALALSGRNPAIAENASRSARFWKGVLEPSPEAPAASENAPKVKAKGDTVRVPIELPMPARLDLSGTKTLLVVSFLARKSDLLDPSREVARFLRNEFRKGSSLQVLEVTPLPAIPEQSLEDLAANREFWQMMGKEHGADLVVSGKILFDRRDASGFRDVEEVSPVTGQKVRNTRFVEQEQFTYQLDVIFMDGRSGELRFRDHMERGAVFQGQANDPITAFYQLGEEISADVLAVVAPRTRQDTRVLFRG